MKLPDKAEDAGKTPFQKFQDLTGKLVQVPKAELDKEIRAERAKRKKPKIK